jgi:tetratricopeptide (TPR) repeat protein
MSDPVELDVPKPVYRPVTAPARRDGTLVAITLLAAAALAGTIALLPSSEEKAQGLMASGRYDDAIVMLVAVEAERPLDAYESYLLFHLYMVTQQPNGAATLLDREPALQADNAWALRQISDLYRATGNIPGEASTLRRLYDFSPTDTDFARLRILYRLTGDFANESSLLSQAIAAGRTEPSNVERLAYLRSLPSSGGQVAVWVAPGGKFRELATPWPSQVLAASGFVTPPADALLE